MKKQYSSKTELKTPFLPIIDKEFKWITDNPEEARQKYRKMLQTVTGSKIVQVDFKKVS